MVEGLHVDAWSVIWHERCLRGTETRTEDGECLSGVTDFHFEKCRQCADYSHYQPISDSRLSSYFNSIWNRDKMKIRRMREMANRSWFIRNTFNTYATTCIPEKDLWSRSPLCAQYLCMRSTHKSVLGILDVVFRERILKMFVEPISAIVDVKRSLFRLSAGLR